MAEYVPDFLDFDSVLEYVGPMGRYQVFLFFAIGEYVLLMGFLYFSPYFMMLVPDHFCEISELSHLSLEDQKALGIPKVNDDEYDKCLMYDVNFTQVLQENMTKANHTWPTKECSSWVYDFTKDIKFPSMSTDYNWVCHKESYPTYVQAIFFVGSITGGLFFGWMSDRFGRLPALVFANLVGFLGGICTPFADQLWEFLIVRYVAGLAYDNCYTMIYIIGR